MVIGNGLIASQFYDYHLNPDVVIFASGVSNSSSNDLAGFRREKDLLLEAIQKYPERKLVYFSTCSIYDPSLQQSYYVQHKLEVEAIIQKKAKRYLILRLSNPIGKNNNPHTFFNFFVNCIQGNQPFEVWSHAERNIIDVDDFYKLAKAMIDNAEFGNQVLNLANPHNYKVLEIVEATEKYFGIKGNYTVMKKGNRLAINTDLVSSLAPKLHIEFEPDYIQKLLQKYFPL